MEPLQPQTAYKSVPTLDFLGLVPAIAIRIILVILNAIFADPSIRISLNAIPRALSL